MAHRGRSEPRASQTWKASERFETVAVALGAKIRWWRKRHHLTLEAAAERMDMDWRHLHKIEAGQLNLTLVTLIRIADGLGKPLSSLVRGLPGREADDAEGSGSPPPK